jgi:hypothetical protein
MGVSVRYARTTNLENKLTVLIAYNGLHGHYLLHIYEFINDNSLSHISHCGAEIWRVQETRSSKITKLDGEHYEI